MFGVYFAYPVSPYSALLWCAFMVLLMKFKDYKLALFLPLFGAFLYDLVWTETSIFFNINQPIIVWPPIWAIWLGGISLAIIALKYNWKDFIPIWGYVIFEILAVYFTHSTALDSRILLESVAIPLLLLSVKVTYARSTDILPKADNSDTHSRTDSQ